MVDAVFIIEVSPGGPGFAENGCDGFDVAGLKGDVLFNGF